MEGVWPETPEPEHLAADWPDTRAHYWQCAGAAPVIPGQDQVHSRLRWVLISSLRILTSLHGSKQSLFVLISLHWVLIIPNCLLHWFLIVLRFFMGSNFCL